MYKFYQEGQFCDFSIKVQDRVYKVRCIAPDIEGVSGKYFYFSMKTYVVDSDKKCHGEALQMRIRKVKHLQ